MLHFQESLSTNLNIYPIHLVFYSSDEFGQFWESGASYLNNMICPAYLLKIAHSSLDLASQVDREVKKDFGTIAINIQRTEY